jgi:thymidylate kinase
MVPESVRLDQAVDAFRHLHPVQIVHIRNGRLAFFFRSGDIYLGVDVFNGDAKWRGIPFTDHRDILAHRWNDDGIMVASPLHQAQVVWLSKLLWTNAVPKRYEPLIEDAVLSDPSAFRARLVPPFGEELADELLDLAIEGLIQESTKLIARCKQQLVKRTLRRHPFRTTGIAIDGMWSALHNRLRPTGLKVAVLGPDGVGKTSVCSRLANAPSRTIPFKHIHHRLLYRRVLPPFSVIESRIRRRPVKRRIDPQNPHASHPHHPLMSMVKFSYYTLDQWISELLWARAQLSYGDLILLDRHLIELSIDPRRYRYSGSEAFARLLGRLAPSPDLVLVFDAPPELVQSRKQDVPFEETLRQRLAYLALAERLPQARVIDASQPLDDVIADVREAIVDRVRERTRRRFRLMNPPSSSNGQKTEIAMREGATR